MVELMTGSRLYRPRCPVCSAIRVPVDAVTAVSVERVAERLELALRTSSAATPASLGSAAAPPERRDGLWEHTCFEAFPADPRRLSRVQFLALDRMGRLALRTPIVNGSGMRDGARHRCRRRRGSPDAASTASSCARMLDDAGVADRAVRDDRGEGRQQSPIGRSPIRRESPISIIRIALRSNSRHSSEP